MLTCGAGWWPGSGMSSTHTPASSSMRAGEHTSCPTATLMRCACCCVNLVAGHLAAGQSSNPLGSRLAKPCAAQTGVSDSWRAELCLPSANTTCPLSSSANASATITVNKLARAHCCSGCPGPGSELPGERHLTQCFTFECTCSAV